ncbi:hypothetical protein [Moheibacter lacus]|uniref:Uracil DNA glycosylase superfamily protein n=1 Tax=Moheibacter lacus TaxID=2745851 RepID=A0A838ZM98_9FLAO|nr:hypothetical protein [Moheibacter lacus]MBA5628706.1 hypothetical protein [Moheibacter lacus]
MNEINPEWIQNRIENFFGYGNLNSPIWFIGIEEGFRVRDRYQNGIDLLKLRFERTYNQNSIDVVGGMEGVSDHLKWYQNATEIQDTYKRLIQILLQWRGQPIDDSSVLGVFNDNVNGLGRINSDNAILELLPLPNPDLGQWIYEEYAEGDLDFLRDRKTYQKSVRKERVEGLKRLVQEYEPEVIVFYSRSYVNEAKKLIENPVLHNEEDTELYYHFSSGKTHLFVTPHPTHRYKLKTGRVPDDNDWTTIRNAIVDVLNNN